VKRFVDVARLTSIYGPIGTARIGRGLITGSTVQFTDRGRTYAMPPGKSTVYHLLESVQKLRRLADHVRPDDRTIVDVGAHAGLFSAFALERASAASALLVEPEPTMRQVIERNVRGSYQLVQVAVSDRAGEATFHRAESSQESSLVETTIRSRHQPLTVETMTLDELSADLEAIDVLKIDVQGAEHLVLSAGRATLARTRTLLIEVSMADPNPHEVLAELVRDFGPWQVINPVWMGADLLFER
jgi:FkbM family methyltransferase